MINNTDGKANRARGDEFELCVIQKLEQVGFKHVVNTRDIDDELDKQGVDVCINNEIQYSYLPYNLSIKATSKLENYPAILDKLPKDNKVNVLLHRKYMKGNIVGEYAILPLNSFLNLIRNNE